MTIPNRDEHLHQLLTKIESDRITRRTNQIEIDYVPANLAQTMGVSTLDELGWLIWIPLHGTSTVHGCCLSAAGIEALLAWENELWGPVEAVLSSRPLTAGDALAALGVPCHPSDLGLSDAEMDAFRSAFAVLDRKDRKT